jgi:hydroxyacylglutathione hydrolase
MTHVVTVPEPPFAAMGGRLIVHQIPAATDNLVWLLVCAETGEAAVVDGPDASGALEAVHRLGVRLVAVLNTHTHGDHVGINRDLQARGLLSDLRVFGPAAAAGDVPGLTDPVDEGGVARFGNLDGAVLRTDGHLDGHVSFVFGDALFCGDTLFTGGCGYLFSGRPDLMFRSLMRLAALPPDTRVCCAHEYTQDNLRFAWSVEPDNAALASRIQAVWAKRAAGRCCVPSTIAEERATNPFLRPGSPSIRAAVGLPAGTPLEVFTAARALKNQKLYRDLLPDGPAPL